MDSELLQQQELFFAAEPPGQTERALELLTGLGNLEAEPGQQPHSLRVRYNLQNYSLEGLELALTKEGFHLDNSLLHQLNRKIAYYREEMQYHNLNTPELHTRNREREIFVKVYENHPHGDHDETPEELREYK